MLPALVPELTVSDLKRSLAFYGDVLGVGVRYARVDEGFACLELGSAVLMLDQLGIGRDWVTGALQPPFGRGINIQIQVVNLSPLLDHLDAGAVPLFQAVETRTYAVAEQMVTQRQCCVQDPDGYLLRFCEIVP
jgi:catechol 2,3-dioxygenase-like lactoylglutathione lyase family enzyme